MYALQTFLDLESSPPQSGKDTISPVVGGSIQSSEHLRCGDSFRVHS